MIPKMRALIVAVAVISGLAGLGQGAYALGKHTPKPPKVQRHAKKNSNLYAYLAPKKQKKQKTSEGWYQSPVSGQMVYGTKKK